MTEQAGSINDEEILTRAMALVQPDRHQSTDLLAVAVAAGPTQQILRPGEIERADLCEEVKREAMFGKERVLDSERGARCDVKDDLLVLANDVEVVVLDPLGSVAVHRPAGRSPSNVAGLNPIIEEDVAEGIERSLGFAGVVLDLIDAALRLTAVAPVAALQGRALGWRTRAQQAASPNTMSVGLGTGQDQSPVRLSPIARPRRHLKIKAAELAEDLTVLLRRQVQS